MSPPTSADINGATYRWVAATIVVSAGCAWLSWHLVKKRALALKNWGPGRGIRHWYAKTVAGVDWIRHRRSRTISLQE